MFEKWTGLSSVATILEPDDASRRADTATVRAGLTSNTMLATANGWKRADKIQEGEMVLTFDSGLQRVTKVERSPYWDAEGDCPKRDWLLEIPAGALGNPETLQLSAQQNVMIESDTAEDLYGDPFTLIPAVALVGVRGIHRVPPQAEEELVQIHFASEQVVFTEMGLLVLCPASQDMLDIAFDEQRDPLYAILPMQEARAIAATIGDEVAVSAESTAPQDLLVQVSA